jgi:hypothetical protein
MSNNLTQIIEESEIREIFKGYFLEDILLSRKKLNVIHYEIEYSSDESSDNENDYHSDDENNKTKFCLYLKNKKNKNSKKEKTQCCIF